MSPWLTRPRHLLRKTNVTRRPRLSRLVLENLEERCLLSIGFGQINLASDVPGLARATDPNLVNPWGIAFSPSSPFWFADNGTGVSDILDAHGQPVPLVVAVPSAPVYDGGPTGVVVNPGFGFTISENGVSAPGTFLFATGNGTISAWNATVDLNNALQVVSDSSAGASYMGLALAVDPTGQSFLYAADFGRGTIDVFDQHFQPVVSAGAFQDPNLPAGYVPFNIQTIGNQLFVTYAIKDATGTDTVNGPTHGFIDVYNTNGDLVKRFASQGALNSPWGLAVAPANYGPFGGALLVGNNGDGTISAFNASTGAFLGQLTDDSGNPIVVPGVWGLTFGNGGDGGDTNTLFFAAGIDDGEHGLFGAIQSPQKRGTDTAGSGVFDPNAAGEPPDYPLPPVGGPALQSGNEEPVSIAVLYPQAESSLALVPTLATAPPPATRLDTPAAGSLVPVAFNGSVTTAQASGGSNRSTDQDDSLSITQNEPVALSTFLDLTPATNSSEKNATLARTAPLGNANNNYASPSLDQIPKGERWFDESLAVRPSVANVIRTNPPVGNANEDGDIETTEAPATTLAQVNNGGWANHFQNLLGLASMVAVWGFVQRFRTRARTAGREAATISLATKTPDPAA